LSRTPLNVALHVPCVRWVEGSTAPAGESNPEEIRARRLAERAYAAPKIEVARFGTPLVSAKRPDAF
jgi:hypothetical protein